MAVTLSLTITENSHSIDNNTSNVTVAVNVNYTGGSYNKNKCYGELTIDNTVYSFTNSFNWYQASSGTETLFTKTATVPHNADGSKTLYCYAFFETGVSSGNIDKSGSLVLTKIPREGSLTAAPNFNDEDNPTINYDNPAGSSAVVSACISLDGSKDDIAYRTIPANGNSYTFNLTDAERNVLRNATTTSNSRHVRFYLRTTIGGKQYLTYLEKTFSIVNAYPTFTATVKDIDADMLLLTGDANKIVRYYSNPQYSISATGLKGATIKSYKVVCGSETKTTSTGTFYNVTSNNIVITVTDSRGNWRKQTITKELVPYVKLTCNIGGSTPDTQGNFSFTVKGNYFNSSFGSVSNTLNVYYRWKKDGDFSEWQAMSATLNGNTYTATANITGLDYRATYIFQAYAEDKISTIQTEEKHIKASPVFDWSENDFNVNVDFNIRGKGVLRVNAENNNTVLSAEGAKDGVFIRPNGTGSNEAQIYFTPDNKMQTESGFMLRSKDSSGNVMNALELYDDNNNLYINHGGYSTNKGTTYLRGNSVEIQSKGKVFINGVAYDGNKVLWSGGHLMSSSQSINLSENITAQANGIVLVFSRYSNGASENANFNTFFVPKQYIINHSGAGMAFNMFTVNFSVACCKYLYVSDGAISGNDLNTATGTGTSGIKYENNAYVLRYVIGV